MKVTIELTDSELRDLLITAGEQGCGYWAETHIAMANAATSRGCVKVYDREEPEMLLGVLTKAKLKKLVLEPGKDGVKAILSSVAVGYFDANSADVWVQFALFGEERYA